MKNFAKVPVTVLLLILAIVIIAGLIYDIYYQRLSTRIAVENASRTPTYPDAGDDQNSNGTYSYNSYDVDESTLTCMDNAKTTLDSSSCAHDQLAADNKNINKIYNALLAKINAHISSGDYPVPIPDGLQNFKTNLIDAERTWISYRDKECAAMTGINTLGGSKAQVDYVLCQSRLTREQIIKLQGIDVEWFSAEGTSY
jgi:uncharacterized protein YecT (DUF1311 family)